MTKIRSEFPQTPLNLTLREEQISTILYCLEGYDYYNFDWEEFDYETVSIEEEEIPEQQLTLSGVF